MPVAKDCDRLFLLRLLARFKTAIPLIAVLSEQNGALRFSKKDKKRKFFNSDYWLDFRRQSLESLQSWRKGKDRLYLQALQRFSGLSGALRFFKKDKKRKLFNSDYWLDFRRQPLESLQSCRKGKDRLYLQALQRFSGLSGALRFFKKDKKRKLFNSDYWLDFRRQPLESLQSCRKGKDRLYLQALQRFSGLSGALRFS